MVEDAKYLDITLKHHFLFSDLLECFSLFLEGGGIQKFFFQNKNFLAQFYLFTFYSAFITKSNNRAFRTKGGRNCFRVDESDEFTVLDFIYLFN